MEKELILVLQDINKKVKKFYSDKKRANYEKLIKEIIDEYTALEIPEERIEIYESLISRGKELQKDVNMKEHKKVDFYLGYCRATVFDFKDNIKPVADILKLYSLMAATFFVLSPQYFSFVLPLVFLLPVFLGFRGIRNRLFNGLLIALALVPMGILVSMVWIRNAFLTISTGTFGEFINGLAQSYNISYEFSRNLAIVFILMSVVLLVSSISFAVYSIKYRKMFI